MLTFVLWIFLTFNLDAYVICPLWHIEFLRPFRWKWGKTLYPYFYSRGANLRSPNCGMFHVKHHVQKFWAENSACVCEDHKVFYDFFRVFSVWKFYTHTCIIIPNYTHILPFPTFRYLILTHSPTFYHKTRFFAQKRTRIHTC